MQNTWNNLINYLLQGKKRGGEERLATGWVELSLHTEESLV